MPAHNVTQQINYIVRFRDWRLTHSVTLALDVPKIGTIRSGEFNNRRLLAFQPSRGYLCFGTKQLELGSVNWNVYYPYRVFDLVIQSNQGFVIGADSNNHFIRRAYF